MSPEIIWRPNYSGDGQYVEIFAIEVGEAKYEAEIRSPFVEGPNPTLDPHCILVPFLKIRVNSGNECDFETEPLRPHRHPTKFDKRVVDSCGKGWGAHP